MEEMDKSFINQEQDKCIIFLKQKDKFIPVVGFNETSNGYFVNFYDISQHFSRHKTLTAWRLSTEENLVSQKAVKNINDRTYPEVLPSKTFQMSKVNFKEGFNKKAMPSGNLFYIISSRKFD